MTLVGLALRKGEVELVQKVFEKFNKRYTDKNDFTHEFLRGLIRSRRHAIKFEYYAFLEQAGRFFVESIGAEEFPRPIAQHGLGNG